MTPLDDLFDRINFDTWASANPAASRSHPFFIKVIRHPDLIDYCRNGFRAVVYSDNTMPTNFSTLIAFTALHARFGESPVQAENRGRIVEMARDWLKYLDEYEKALPKEGL